MSDNKYLKMFLDKWSIEELSASSINMDIQLKSELLTISKNPLEIEKLKIALRAVEEMTSKITKSRVALFSLRELHLPILKLLIEELKAYANIEIGVSSVPYKAGVDNYPEEGLKPATIERLKADGIEFWGTEKPESPYDCVVTADACADRIEGHGPIVCVGHGTISKNIYFIDNANTRRESFNTVLCVPGEWYKESFGKNIHFEIIPTGFPKMDDLAKDYEYFKMDLFAKANFSLKKKTILFAPTYNLELTGMATMAEEWGKLNREKYQVLVKLHGATVEPLVRLYKKICELLPNLFFVDDQNLAPYLKISDLIVSDVSSAYVEAYAANIPVIVVDNPQMYSFSGYNPEAIEFKVRDGAYRISEGSEFRKILTQLELGFDPLISKRIQYAKELFSQIDGGNSRRVAEVIHEVVTKKIIKKPLHDFSFLVLKNANLSQVKENLKRSFFKTKIFLEDPCLKPYFEDFTETYLLEDEPTLSCNWILLDGTHELGLDWDFIFDLTLRYNTHVKFLGPMYGEGDSHFYQDYTKVINNRINGSDDLIRWYLKYTQFSNVMSCNYLNADALLINQYFTCEEVKAFSNKMRNLQNETVSGHVALGQLAYIRSTKNTMASEVYCD